MTDDDLIDAIERIRGENNTRWMELVRLAVRVAPDQAKALLRDIQRLDGEVRRLTQELAK